MFEMGSNCEKHGGHQEESPPASEKRWQLYSAAKGETAKITITAAPSTEEFREQRRRKRKHTDNADKRVKKPTTTTNISSKTYTIAKAYEGLTEGQL
jgi:hypothetical protein